MELVPNITARLHAAERERDKHLRQRELNKIGSQILRNNRPKTGPDVPAQRPREPEPIPNGPWFPLSHLRRLMSEKNKPHSTGRRVITS